MHQGFHAGKAQAPSNGGSCCINCMSCGMYGPAVANQIGGQSAAEAGKLFLYQWSQARPECSAVSGRKNTGARTAVHYSYNKRTGRSRRYGGHAIFEHFVTLTCPIGTHTPWLPQQTVMVHPRAPAPQMMMQPMHQSAGQMAPMPMHQAEGQRIAPAHNTTL